METALYDGVVFGEVAEGEGVAGVGGDDGGVEGELGVCADGDGDVGREGEGEEGDEGKGEGEIHDDDVVVLACSGGLTSAFTVWLGAKVRDSREFELIVWTKGKCSLSEKECLSYKKGQKRQSCLLYLISQKLTWKQSYGP